MHYTYVLQKYASNQESMATLQEHIESMNTMIESVLPKGTPCPSMLQNPLRIFHEYVRISIPKLANLPSVPSC